MNLFEKDIKPKWEDERNNYGRTLTMQYEVPNDLDAFLKTIQTSWLKLMLMLIGESIQGSSYVSFIHKPRLTESDLSTKPKLAERTCLDSKFGSRKAFPINSWMS